MLTNEELNTKLYDKMAAAQEQYREWLLSLPPEEILQHCFEYAIREDILFAHEELDLSDKQCLALLNLQDPLTEIYQSYQCMESSYMEDIRSAIESEAVSALRSKTYEER